MTTAASAPIDAGIAATSGTAAAALSVRELHAYYGRSHVLHGIGFDVGRHQVVALLGRNGAGKTTALRALMNLIPRSGQVCLFGEALGGDAPPYAVVRRGMTLVLENRGTFPSLSVDEALRVAGGRPGPWQRGRVLALFPRLAERLRQRCGHLSGGEQQMVAIGRALLLNPRMLLLDEPTQGLAPIIVRELLDQLQAVKAEGMSILLVEQNLEFARRLSDQAVVLGKGAIRWSGPMAGLDSEPEVQSAWLGV